MLRRDKSITTSSKSSTNSEVPIQFVKGVGPRLGAVFNSRQIYHVRDLLYFFPRTYQDRSHFNKIAELEDGVTTTLSVTVVNSRQIPIHRLGKSILEVRCEDETGQLSLKWFHSPRGMEKRFIQGVQLMITGKIKFYMNRPEMVHPEITWGVSSETVETESHHNVGRVVPVYTELEGIPSRTLRKVLWEALQKYSSSLIEDLPSYLLERRELFPLREAVNALHFPPENEVFELSSLADFNTPAHHRLIYGEFFKFEYLMLRRKMNIEKQFSISFGALKGNAEVERLKQMLPFQLTRGQNEALNEILKDFSEPHPMNRLVQGDVGSGKTAVAFLSAACVLAEGGQAALMAPTEILAEQHYKNAFKLFQGKLAVGLLTGKTSQSERNTLHRRLSSGEPLLLIGTHALIEDSVVFNGLAYVMVDEQHRFGVEQRRTLRQKGVRVEPGSNKKILPHSLILTATPIPRTLALTAFGDLSVSSIRELPPGRSPVKTRVVRDRSGKLGCYEQIRQELVSGRQAYFIYPLVNDSEAEGFTQLKSAVSEAELLAQEVFPEFQVGLLHGQMSPQDKASIMERFQQGKVQILVSTTVVEVGVDVPNATIIAIEHAERFGLSQLHQLRGRVGRGKFQSYCFLFSGQKPGDAQQPTRLEVLEETQDGFKIAEADLEIRGPGEFLGTRQAGGLPFKLANLVRDREWLLLAREDAIEVMAKDPDLTRPEHQPLRSYYEREGGVQFGRLQTS